MKEQTEDDELRSELTRILRPLLRQFGKPIHVQHGSIGHCVVRLDQDVDCVIIEAVGSITDLMESQHLSALQINDEAGIEREK